MTKLCDLLGSRSEAVYECMYTKHKTQKRKIWQDGFVALFASRKLVVYADDEGKTGKAVDEAKLAPVDWDRKDEDYFETSKFLVEIVNEIPVGHTPSTQAIVPNGAKCNKFESTAIAQQPASNRVGARPGFSSGLGGRPPFNSKFRTPLSRGPPREASPGAAGRVGCPSSRIKPTPCNLPTPPSSSLGPVFDFSINPTSEWNYVPNAVNRTPDEVLAMLDK